MSEPVVHEMKSCEKGTATTKCGKKLPTTSTSVTAWPSLVTCPPCQAARYGAG